MLKRLIVKSFAIIEDLTLDFENGMTVLTGETGAGKSLIIDTISLLLGARADTDMIRYQDNCAIINGEFTYNNVEIDNILEDYGIVNLNGILNISREIYQNSKNIIKINNITTNLTVLKNISSLLADIHVQHDTYRLFNPESYLYFIDPTDDILFSKVKNDYIVSLSEYLSFKKEYDIIIQGKNKAIERLEFLEYEKAEISGYHLFKNIDTDLEDKINKLKNFDKIYQSLTSTYNLLENDSFNIDNLFDSYKELKKISIYDTKYESISSNLIESYDLISEVKKILNNQIQDLDFNQNEFDNLIIQLDDINRLKIKYKKNVTELIEYLQTISLELEIANNYDSLLEESKKNVVNFFNKLKNNANKLTEYRKKYSLEIEKSIVEECFDLELSDTVFKIVFNETNYNDPFDSSIFYENGVDKIDFMISLNKGEPVKPLNKTASGGEMSRIMLAFKSYFSKKSNLSLMVFDEIDSGISGITASQIAKKILNISKKMQVLCITHMPQVAAIGNHHLYIYKEVENNRTKTMIHKLDYNQRVEKIATMLSGKNLSKFAIDHAKELLEESK